MSKAFSPEHSHPVEHQGLLERMLSNGNDELIAEFNSRSAMRYGVQSRLFQTDDGFAWTFAGFRWLLKLPRFSIAVELLASEAGDVILVGEMKTGFPASKFQELWGGWLRYLQCASNKNPGVVFGLDITNFMLAISAKESTR